MIEHDELQYEKRARAGFIPYIYDNEEECFKYLMMISSDPKLGGPRPMISKGKIESDETDYECAMREAEEELGLKLSNLAEEPFFLIKEKTVLRSGSYNITVYAGKIIDRSDFDMWCDETQYIEWHSLKSFEEHGRRDHIPYVRLLEQIVTEKHESTTA